VTDPFRQDEDAASQGPSSRIWIDYVAAVVGSVVGGYLIGWRLVDWAVGSGSGILAAASLGQILLIPLGSALGTMFALAASRRRSAVFTGVLTLPVTFFVWIVIGFLAMLVDATGYGWPAVISIAAAPLGARFIVLGRPSSESDWPAGQADRPGWTFREWPIGRIIRYGVPILLAASIVALVIYWPESAPEVVAAEQPLGPRVCECEILTERVESLPLSPRFRTASLRVSELSEGFVVEASDYVDDDLDVDYYWTVFGEAGFTGVRLFDQPDHQSATFYEGETRNESPWIVDVSLRDSRLDMTFRIRVDGSEWGIATTDDLWKVYTSDREAAAVIHEERQEKALDVLESFQQALEDVGNG
jgi:hypothetical protein